MTTPLTYLPGTAIYLRTDGDQLQVVRIIAGQPPTTTTIGTVDSEEKMTSTLSPDGVTIAFETRCDLPGPGDLVIDRSTGSTRRTVASSVLCVGGPHPIWLADSASLRVCRDAGDCGRLDVATGTYTPLGHDAGWGEYVAFSPGGAFRARRVNARFVVETPAGVEVGYVPIPPNLVPVEGRCIQALSADGHYLAFGPCNTDFSIHRDVRWVDDTYTKEPVSLATLLGRSPADGEELDGLSFLADGGAVVATVTNQVFRWYLLSSIGVVTAIVDDAPGRILTGQFVYLP